MKSLLLLSLVFLVPALSHAEYSGSSFSEVWKVINGVGFKPKTEIEAREFSVYEKSLPVYPVDATSLFGGGSRQLEKDAVRTVSEREDYYDRLPKLLHPNGVCVAGIWQITEKTNYTGMFKQGTKSPIIGRISVSMGKTDFRSKRGFGFAGKVFPTRSKTEVVETSNFFTVDVLLGQKNSRVFETSMTNEPETGFDFTLIGLALKISAALSAADTNPGFRPLYPLSQANTPASEAVTPQWIRITPNKIAKVNKEDDFRNEILKALNDNKVLTFDIAVSDTTKNRLDHAAWKKVGEIAINDAAASYGCDRQLHFAHPKLAQ